MGRDNGYKPSARCHLTTKRVTGAIRALRGEDANLVDVLMDRAIVHVKVRVPQRQFGTAAAEELVGKTLALLAQFDDNDLRLILADNQRRCGR